jgi:hypothetical protein
VTPAAVDVPTRLLAVATRLLPADRATWGEAMVGELAQLERPVDRRRFALGCLRAVVLSPPSRGEPGRSVVGVVVVGTAASVALAGYALVRYPGLRAGGGVWVALATFLAILLCYAVATLAVVGNLGGAARPVARRALVGGSVVALLWVLIGVAATSSAYPGWVPVLLIPLACLTVGASGARRGRAAAGCQTALLAAVVAGLGLFVVAVGAALLTAGHPHDAGLVRDFPASGAPDLATYSVDDSLGTAMVLLLLVPLLTMTIGSLGATLASRRRAAGRTAS